MHSLGLDGMTVHLFQTCWHIVGEYVTLVMLGCLFFLFFLFFFGWSAWLSYDPFES